MPRRNDFVDNAQIEPCPFCWHAAQQTRNVVENPLSLRYWISCGNQAKCGAEGPKRKTAIGAIKAWNSAHLYIMARPGKNIDDYDDD